MKNRKKIGIIVSCLVGLLCLGLLVFFAYRKLEQEQDVENPIFTMYWPNGTHLSFEGKDAWELKNAMGLDSLSYKKNKVCKCETGYTIEIKTRFREQQYEIHLEEGIVCAKKGQAHLEKDSLEYEAIQEGIMALRYHAKMNDMQLDTSHLGFSVQYVYTGSNSEYIPTATYIRSLEELQQYFNENMVNEDGEEHPDAERFRTATQSFDEEYFKKQVLVIVEKGEGSGSVRHDVTGVFKNQDGELEIVIEEVFLGFGTADVAGWHFFIEIAEDMNVTGDEKIKIVLDGEVVENPVVTMKCSDGTTFVGDGSIAFSIKNVISNYLLKGNENNCTCLPEYIVTIESDMRHEVYEINLSQGCVHYDGKSVSLENWQKRDLVHSIAERMDEMEMPENPVAIMKYLDGTTYFCKGVRAFELKTSLFGVLDFSKEDTSNWSPEYVVTIESDVRHEVYEINLTEGCVRYDGKMVLLNEEEKRIMEEEIDYYLSYVKKK